MTSESKDKDTGKKPRPPTLGLAVVADLWLWGALLLFAPKYLGITSGWQIPFYLLGSICLIISFGGALTELGKLWKTEGLSYWGASMVLLTPAAALFITVEWQYITEVLSIVAKIAALILAAIGGAIFFHGIPYFFWKQHDEIEGASKVDADLEAEDKKRAKRKVNFEVVANIIIALHALATAVVTFAQKLTP